MELKKNITYTLTDQEKFAFELVEDILNELTIRLDEENTYTIKGYHLNEIDKCINLLCDIREKSE